VCGIEGATSSEFDPSAKEAVVDVMPDQAAVSAKGGTMRLGQYPCNLEANTLAHKLYGSTRISERHRHRYEVNNNYRELLKEKGLTISGVSPDYRLVEMIELPGHPWFLGCQFHPEFTSTPRTGHPLFQGFVEAAIRQRQQRRQEVIAP